MEIARALLAAKFERTFLRLEATASACAAEPETGEEPLRGVRWPHAQFVEVDPGCFRRW